MSDFSDTEDDKIYKAIIAAASSTVAALYVFLPLLQNKNGAWMCHGLQAKGKHRKTRANNS